MKKTILNILSGALGGTLVLTGFLYLNKPEQNLLSPDSGYAKTVNLNAAIVTGPDFTYAAEKGLNSVVQINAQESKKQIQKNQEESIYNNPLFRDFNLGQFGFGYPYYQPKKGSGSGVIFSDDGYIITNNHVVEFADEIEVILKDGRKLNATKIGSDPNTDLAVLKVEASDLPVLEIANSDNLKIGEWVLAVGNPLGFLNSTVTAGIVSAKGRDLNLLDSQPEDQFGFQQNRRQTPQYKGIEEYIQTDAAVNPGNSGGALVDAQGRLVGINSAIASKTGYYSGYSFAIPSNLMSKIVKELIKYGSFERGRMGVGVEVVNIDEDLKKNLNLSSNTGVVITELEEKSSAKYAGLLPNDVIIAINGKDIGSVEELQKIVGLTKVGETLNTRIIRNGKVLDIPVKIKKMI